MEKVLMKGNEDGLELSFAYACRDKSMTFMLMVIATLDRIKKNRKGVSESKTILKSRLEELAESIDESEEIEVDLGGIIEKLME